MNGIFEPFHRSYRMTMTMAVLVGVFGFGTFYYMEKYINTKAMLEQCYEATNLQAAELVQCRNTNTQLNADNALLNQEIQRLYQDFATVMDTIANLEAQNETYHQVIASLEEQIASLQILEFENSLIIDQLKDELETSRRNLVNTQSQLESLERQNKLLRAKLVGVVTLANLFTLLSHNMLPFLSIFFIAAVAVPYTVRLDRRDFPKRNKPKSSSKDRVWVCMTRETARDHARRSRSVKKVN